MTRGAPKFTAEQMDEFGRWMRSVQVDSAESAAISARLDAHAAERALRDSASLVVRCGDCRGRVIAHVTFINGRPLLWVRLKDGTGHRSFVDDEFWGDYAYCTRNRQYPLPSDVLRSVLPAPNLGRRTMIVSHGTDDATLS